MDSPEIADLILSTGQVDPDCVDSRQQTPLDAACSTNGVRSI